MQPKCNKKISGASSKEGSIKDFGLRISRVLLKDALDCRNKTKNGTSQVCKFRSITTTDPKFLLLLQAASLGDPREIFGYCSDCIFRRCSRNFIVAFQWHLSAMLQKISTSLFHSRCISQHAPELFILYPSRIFQRCSVFL